MQIHKSCSSAKENETHLRELIDVLPQIIWTLDSDGCVESCNRRWYEYTRMTLQESRQADWQSIYHPEDIPRLRDAWIQAQETESAFEIEYRFRKYDGTYRWFLAKVLPLHPTDGKVSKWLGSATEIETQKRLLDTLYFERELREKFVTTLTHDLRTPLTAAKMSAQLIRRKKNKDTEDELCSRIIQHIDRVDQMIRDLLDVSRIKAGEKLALRISYFELGSLIEDTLKELSTIHGNRFLALKTSPIMGTWDSSGIRRILENLCSNAVKYGDNRSPITVSYHQEKDFTVLSVHNEGIAMRPNEQTSLFQQFQRSESAQSSGKKGWGIGLTIVKGIAEAHGGSVSVNSESGFGTTFTIKLPRSDFH